MKNLFTYIAIFALSLFSFYYTDKVVNIIRDNDPMMIQIMSMEDTKNIPCSEGYVVGEGVVIGLDGKSINKIESFNNMRGIGFDESLLVFETNKCLVTKEENLDKYIIKGNKDKNAVSILIEGNNLIENTINLAKEKNIPITYIVNDNNLDIMDKYKNLDYVYSGVTKSGLKKYIKKMKSYGKEGYCITINADNLGICKENKVNTIKSNLYLEKNVFINAKNNIDKGSFLIIKETKDNIKELSILINYVKNKGYKILDVNEHLVSER